MVGFPNYSHICLLIHSPSIWTANAKEIVKQAMMVSISSRDKTCNDCFSSTFARSGNVLLQWACITNLSERIVKLKTSTKFHFLGVYQINMWCQES